MSERYLEDLQPGQTFRTGSIEIDEASIKRFAGEFDPQPFHLDEQAARESMFGGLAASGWHTAAVTMRLLVESDFRPAGGVIGGSLDELRWPKPVWAGDMLRAEVEVLEVRRSRSRPERGFAKVRVTTLNQHDEPVQIYVGNLVVLSRDGGGELGVGCLAGPMRRDNGVRWGVSVEIDPPLRTFSPIWVRRRRTGSPEIWSCDPGQCLVVLPPKLFPANGAGAARQAIVAAADGRRAVQWARVFHCQRIAAGSECLHDFL
jgi:acyl dehydratase